MNKSNITDSHACRTNFYLKIAFIQARYAPRKQLHQYLSVSLLRLERTKLRAKRKPEASLTAPTVLAKKAKRLSENRVSINDNQAVSERPQNVTDQETKDK